MKTVAKEISCTLNVEQQETVEQHLDLVSIILRKYINTNEQIRGLEHDDLYQCGCLALCKAVDHAQKSRQKIKYNCRPNWEASHYYANEDGEGYRSREYT